MTEERSYEVLVEEGKRVALAKTRCNWTLGDLAIEVVGPAATNADNGGGKVKAGKLMQYADDISEPYRRLANCRAVASAWTKSTRVDLVPWVCYRTIYKVEDRFDVMASYVAKCQASGQKPSYRDFQLHIGKEATREYTKANAKETAGQALEDLERSDKVAVIAPEVAKDPEVAKGLLHDEASGPVIVQARRDDLTADLERTTTADIPGHNSMDLIHLVTDARTKLRDFVEQATRNPVMRSSVAGDLLTAGLNDCETAIGWARILLDGNTGITDEGLQAWLSESSK